MSPGIPAIQAARPIRWGKKGPTRWALRYERPYLGMVWELSRREPERPIGRVLGRRRCDSRRGLSTMTYSTTWRLKKSSRSLKSGCTSIELPPQDFHGRKPLFRRSTQPEFEVGAILILAQSEYPQLLDHDFQCTMPHPLPGAYEAVHPRRRVTASPSRGRSRRACTTPRG